MKQLIIIGGANGTGKTTFAIPYVKEKRFAFLNADEIAKKLEEKREKHAMIKAGRLFFQKLHKYLADGKSFVVETTLSGSYINKVAQKALDKGYKVSIIYIFVDDEAICVQRVKNRVLKGGHDVPLKDIIRRFGRSKKNFWQNFTKLANEWNLFYNGEEGFQIVATGNLKRYSVENDFLFSIFKK